MMIERSCIFAMMMAMTMSISSTHATKSDESTVTYVTGGGSDGDSLLRGHRRMDGDDCLSIADSVCDPDDSTALLCELLKTYDLIDALSTGEWTMFAPNEDALKNIIESDKLTEDEIKDALLFHTVKGKSIKSSDLICRETIEMGNGDDSRTKCKDDNIYQTGIGNLGIGSFVSRDGFDSPPKIIEADIKACNGIIHILDGVMLPKLSESTTADVANLSGDDDDDEDEDEESEYVMTEHGDYLDPDMCYGLVGTCQNKTTGGVQMNFNRPAGFSGSCPDNSICSGNGNCECNKDYCAVAGNKCQLTPKPPKPQYKQMVRVRKEWRTLTADERKRVAAAFSIMNTTDTLAGRETYGKHFWNAQDLVVFHVCAVVDPRCDQAHFGPNFMTFHRAYCLLIENSLRAIDPEIIAMPYWDMALDAQYGKYNPKNKDATDSDKEQYIFSDKYIGDYFTLEEDNFVVTNGLFAYWAVPEWIFEKENVYGNPELAGTFRYGPDSDMGRSSLNTTNPGINKVSTCIARGLYLPAQPGTKLPSDNPKSVHCTMSEGNKECLLSKFGCGCGATDQVQDDETYRPGYNQVGQGARSIPDYCSDDCKKDSTKCPLYARADHYTCMKYVQRDPTDKIYSNRFASNTNEITYTTDDFNMCTDPRFINSWMEWQNCIEKRTDGVCEIRLDDDMTKWQWLLGTQSGMAASVGNFSHVGDEERQKEIEEQFVVVNADIKSALKVLAGIEPDKTKLATDGEGRSDFVGLATVWACGNPMGYVDTYNGRIGVNNLHAQGHIRIGLDMFDTGTSSMDMGAFHGHHAHVDKSNMIWMQLMGNEGKARHYGYPTGGQTRDNSNDWIAQSGLTPYGTSGPFGSYDMTYCQDYSVSYRYNGTRPEVQGMTPDRYEFLQGGPWLHGTTLDEVVTENFPFFDLYADYDGGEKGYTHKDVIEHSFPDRTDYTYDSIADDGYYPNVCKDAKDCPPLPP